MQSNNSHQPRKLRWYQSITFKNFLIFFTITTIGQGILVYNYVIDSRDYEISQQTILMENVALRASRSVDASQITTFRRFPETQTLAYQQTRQLLAQIRSESGVDEASRVDNVIIIRRNQTGDYYYVADELKDPFFQFGRSVDIHPIFPETKEAAEEAWKTDRISRSKTFGPPGSHWIQVLAPIKYQNKVDALILVNKNADDIVAARERKVYFIFALSNIILAVGLGAFIFFSRRMLRPLGILQEQSLKVAQGDLQVELSVMNRNDEVGELNNTFIHMIKELDQAHKEASKNWQLKVEESEKVMALNETFTKFVPHEFLEHLNKEKITDIKIGDHVRVNMSVLFSDIRSFTRLSEQMTPAENFHFINSFLEVMGPVIREEGGFIDKYIGDAIMALFNKGADDAVRAAISMCEHLKGFNQEREINNKIPIKLGIGINTGPLMLGTIGEHHRMEGTVISDAVNLASRLEGITKLYGVSIIISQYTVDQLKQKDQYALRVVDHVQVEGKMEPITVYEVFDSDLPEIQEIKRKTLTEFEQAIALYFSQDFEQAETRFQFCLEQCPQDTLSQMYVNRCQDTIQNKHNDLWNGVTVLDRKKFK